MVPGVPSSVCACQLLIVGKPSGHFCWSCPVRTDLPSTLLVLLSMFEIIEVMCPGFSNEIAFVLVVVLVIFYST